MGLGGAKFRSMFFLGVGSCALMNCDFISM